MSIKSVFLHRNIKIGTNERSGGDYLINNFPTNTGHRR